MSCVVFCWSSLNTALLFYSWVFVSMSWLLIKYRVRRNDIGTLTPTLPFTLTIGYPIGPYITFPTPSPYHFPSSFSAPHPEESSGWIFCDVTDGTGSRLSLHWLEMPKSAVCVPSSNGSKGDNANIRQFYSDEFNLKQPC